MKILSSVLCLMFVVFIFTSCKSSSEPKPINPQDIVHYNNLIWQDNKEAKIINKDWIGAKEYCQNLSLHGFSDWYLPSINELASIAEKSKNPAIKKEFKNTFSSYYWSSSDYVYSDNHAWIVFFNNGYQGNSDKSHNGYVRCARVGK